MRTDSPFRRWLGVIVPVAVIWFISAAVTTLMVAYCRYILMPHQAADLDVFAQEAFWRREYAARRLLVTAIGDGLIIAYGLWERGRDKKAGRTPEFPVRMHPAWICLMPVLGVALCLFVNAAMNLSGLVRLLANDYQEVGEALFPAGQEALSLFTVGLLAPLAEELVFRGVIFPRLRGLYRGVVPAVFSAVLFGAFHGNLAQGIYAFCLGFVFAWGYEKTGRFGAAIALHIAANACSLILSGMNLSWGLSDLLIIMGTSGLVLTAGTGLLAKKSADCAALRDGQRSDH